MVVQIVEGAQRIEGQVCRVLLASYTVSLEDVFKVLQTVSDDSIKLWAKVNVCRLESLANIVVETLEICPLSFIVLGRLSSAVQFRDAVFRTCPSLLARLLERSCETGSDERVVSSIIKSASLM
jgi:hypothetical protein